HVTGVQTCALPILGGEPVVVAAVEDHQVVVGDALGGQQFLEALPVDDVTSLRILQLVLPVELHGTRDVPAVVGGRVLVDLGEHHTRGVEVLLGPLDGDKHVFTAHGGTHFPDVFLAGLVDRSY